MYQQNSVNSWFLLALFILVISAALGFSLSSGEDLYVAHAEASQQLALQQVAAQQQLEMELLQAQTEQQIRLAQLQYQEQTATLEQQKQVLNITFPLIISAAAISIILIVATSLIRFLRARKIASKLELEQVSKENLSKWTIPEYRKTKVMHARQQELELRMNKLQQKAQEQEMVAREISKTIATWQSSNSEGSER